METKSKKGFASLDPERRREIAKLGALAVAKKGNGHKFTSETGRIAGKKGGLSVSQNREWMSQIGTVGGSNSRRRARKENVEKLAEVAREVLVGK